MDQFANRIIKSEEENHLIKLYPAGIIITDGEEIKFSLRVFKNINPINDKWAMIDINDVYQYKITYGQVLKDLGRCAFIQIIKANITRAGLTGRKKIVGKIA